MEKESTSPKLSALRYKEASCFGFISGYVHLTCSIFYVLSIAVVISLIPQPLSAQIRLVKDITTGHQVPDPWDFFNMNEGHGSRAFFVGRGSELWTSDGTNAGTKVIKRFEAIKELEVINGVAYISAQTTELGFELWRSDGTAQGTVLLKDIYPAEGSSTPLFLTNVNGTLYFSANNKTQSRELWKSDGTSSGTTLVKDLYPGGTGSNPADLTAVGNKVFFIANTPGPGYELWTSDGSDAGTVLVKDISPGTTGSSIEDMTVSGGWLYFSAQSPGQGRQLWKSDGTTAGTSIVKQINTSGSAQVADITDVDGVVFFQATDGVHGVELWRSDGTSSGTFMVADINEPLRNFSSVNGKLFFMTGSWAPNGSIWVSDGTTGGTQQVTSPTTHPNLFLKEDQIFYDINGSAYFFGGNNTTLQRSMYKISPDYQVSIVRKDVPWDEEDFYDAVRMIEFTNINGIHHFIAEGYYWRTDGTTHGTYRLRTICCGASSNPQNPTDVDGTLFFTTVSPLGLWKTNGDASSTYKVIDSISAGESGSLGNQLFLRARAFDNLGGVSTLWVSDGTTSGTYELSSEAIEPFTFQTAGDNLFFYAETTQYGRELWKTDGTAQGTMMVKDIYPGSSSGSHTGIIALGDKVIFGAVSPEYGRELWVSDGTAAGTHIVKDIVPGSGNAWPEPVTSLNEYFYFLAGDAGGPLGVELWKTDGTPENTSLVKDIRGNDTGEFPERDIRGGVATSDWLFFAAIDSLDKHGIWKTDGTEENTTKVITLEPETEHLPWLIGATESHALFVREFESKLELWVADADTARLLSSIDNQAFFYVDAVRKGNVFYFITGPTYYLDPDPKKLWRTDGTVEGTYQIPFYGDPSQLKRSGDHVYLIGRANKEGYELFVIEENVSAASTRTVAVVKPVQMEEDRSIVSTYPNPVVQSFRLKVDGPVDGTFRLDIMNVNGASILSDRLKYQTENEFEVSTWPAGMYILRINAGDRLITKKVLKMRD